VRKQPGGKSKGREVLKNCSLKDASIAKIKGSFGTKTKKRAASKRGCRTEKESSLKTTVFHVGISKWVRKSWESLATRDCVHLFREGSSKKEERR